MTFSHMEILQSHSHALRPLRILVAAVLLLGLTLAEEIDAVEWTDTQGDVVSLRQEDGRINLYGNGDLALESVKDLQIDGLSILFSNNEMAAESTVTDESIVDKVRSLVEQYERHQSSDRSKQQQILEALGASVVSGQEPSAASTAIDVVENVHTMPQSLLDAMTKRAAQKNHRVADVDYEQLIRKRMQTMGSGQVLRRPSELVIYAEGDPEAPGAKDPRQRKFEDPYRSVLPLGRHSFENNVLQSGEAVAAHWVVLFCYSWWEPCMAMDEPYAAMGAEWQGKLNHGLLNQEVRFAKVDCAVDKELCNAQGVDTFPNVQHYAGGARIAKWKGGRQNDAERLPKWIKKQLGSDASVSSAASADVKKESIWGTWNTFVPYSLLKEQGIDFLLIVGVLALNFGVVCQNAGLWKSPQSPLAHVSRRPSSPNATQVPQQPALQKRIVQQCLPVEWMERRGCLEL